MKTWHENKIQAKRDREGINNEMRLCSRCVIFQGKDRATAKDAVAQGKIAAQEIGNSATDGAGYAASRERQRRQHQTQTENNRQEIVTIWNEPLELELQRRTALWHRVPGMTGFRRSDAGPATQIRTARTCPSSSPVLATTASTAAPGG